MSLKELRSKSTAGLSPILFHRTGVRQAANILKSNRFELKPSEGTNTEEKLSGASYYLSTARSPNSAYIRGGFSSQSVVIELDGVKLGAKYKGKAVDYWGPGFYKNGDQDTRHERFEAEDRVYSPKQFMPAVPYIRAIYLVAPKDGESNKKYLTSIYELRRACLLKKIPIWFFTDFKDVVLRNTKKAIPYKPVGPNSLPDDPNEYVYPRETLEWNATHTGRDEDSLAMWYTLYKLPKKAGVDSYDQLKAMNNKRLLDTYSRLRYDDAINGFEADLHNAKSTQYESNRKEREHLDQLVQVMRKERKTPKQFLDMLRDKWYPRNKSMSSITPLIRLLTAGYDNIPMMDHKFSEVYQQGPVKPGTDNAPEMPDPLEENSRRVPHKENIPHQDLKHDALGLEELSQQLQGMDTDDIGNEVPRTFPNADYGPGQDNKSDINTAPEDTHTIQEFPSSAPYYAKSSPQPGTKFTIDQKLERLKLRRQG